MLTFDINQVFFPFAMAGEQKKGHSLPIKIRKECLLLNFRFLSKLK